MWTVFPISHVPPPGCSAKLEPIPRVFTDAAARDRAPTQILPRSGSLTVGMFLKVLACSFLRYSLHPRREKKATSKDQSVTGITIPDVVPNIKITLKFRSALL